MATRHPLAALAGLAAFLLFFAAGATDYGYLTLVGWTVTNFEVLGVVAVIAGVFAYWWEDRQ